MTRAHAQACPRVHMLDADAFAIRSARKNVPSAEVFHVAGWPKGADALTKRGKCARETNTRVTVGIAATIPISARSRHDLAGGCATIGSSRIRPCTAASRTTSPYCRSPSVVVLILRVARCVVSARARAWAGASAVLAAVAAAAVVVVAGVDTLLWPWQTLIRGARRRLRRNGVLWIVAQEQARQVITGRILSPDSLGDVSRRITGARRPAARPRRSVRVGARRAER